MSTSPIYPQGPQDPPNNLTQASASYKRQASLAMAGLLGFIMFYLALTAFFGYVTYNGVMQILDGQGHLFQILITACSLLLTVFMVKSLLVKRSAAEPSGVEVTAEQEPQLFQFLHTLADDVGAPRPHRVFITPEVNAAVFYDLSLINLSLIHI